MSLMINFTVVGILAMALTTLGASLSLKLKADREKVSPFECGFTPKALARLPFSVRYFLISIIFLIFDVELILLFPLIPALMGPLTLTGLGGLLIVVLILLLGLFHEIAQGSLSWAR